MSSKSKPIKVRVHFNRINMQRRRSDIWTVHTSKACIAAKKVEICCANCGNKILESEYRGPDARQPRAFYTGRVRVSTKNGVATIRG